MSDTRHAYEHAATIPSIANDRALSDRVTALQARYPAHAVVRPAGVRGGPVIDAVVPLDPAALATARAHYRAGGIVRVHARQAADLTPATAEIRA